MPKVSRRRFVPAAPSEVWRIITDPHHLPRWWPGTQRVENVNGEAGSVSWTQVLGTRGGRGMRADYSCTEFEPEHRFVFVQSVAGTPFEKHFRSLEMAITLHAADGGTEVELSRDIRLNGVSRLGSPLMRRGSSGIVEEALEGLETSFAETPETNPQPEV